jgi:CheY-like chemotaxis protein
MALGVNSGISSGQMLEEAVILLVEDRGDDVLVVLRAFELAGLKNRVIVCRDGEEAIQYLKGEGAFANRKEYPLPNLILLDLKMPKIDGFGVLRWLKDHPELKSIATVVLTLSSEIRDVNQAYQLGANSFMVKPDDFSNVAAMSKLLKDYWLLGNKAPGIVHRPDSPS